MKTQVKLTEYSHGAGCGCKISPALLHEILKDSAHHFSDTNLIVGNQEKDDAAVFDLGDGKALISTTDFFMPIVDDPFDFGRIAAVNAISDVYAMGGKPILAIAILGWPINKLSAEVARAVVEGARSICCEVKISLAGGHSIDSPEPIFGLAVNGLINKNEIKTNGRAKVGASIFLTKPLGIGILTTAMKKSEISNEHYQNALKSMLTLNSIGEILGKEAGVLSMTDVTGFGLLGHLREICEASNVSARLEIGKIPSLPGVKSYIEKGCVPGGTQRNLESYGHLTHGFKEEERILLADPQTSGGLIVIVEKGYRSDFIKKFSDQVSQITEIGTIISKSECLISV